MEGLGARGHSAALGLYGWYGAERLPAGASLRAVMTVCGLLSYSRDRFGAGGFRLYLKPGVIAWGRRPAKANPLIAQGEYLVLDKK